MNQGAKEAGQLPSEGERLMDFLNLFRVAAGVRGHHQQRFVTGDEEIKGQHTYYSISGE
jgi:hypothetical protein